MVEVIAVVFVIVLGIVEAMTQRNINRNNRSNKIIFCCCIGCSSSGSTITAKSVVVVVLYKELKDALKTLLFTSAFLIHVAKLCMLHFNFVFAKRQFAISCAYQKR